MARTIGVVTVDIREEDMALVSEHGRVPIAFTVSRVLDVTVVDGGLAGIALSERVVDAPYVKDHDAIAGEGPTRWATTFDTSNWGLLAAYREGERVGGAVIAFDTPHLSMLRGRRDLAVLWDLRIHPDERRRGTGRVLIGAVEEWARARRCRHLEIETQNVNVAACRFYAAMGCTLAAIDRFAYPEIPDEVQLLWHKDLA